MPKAAAVHSGLQSDANPFSPTKKRPVASSSRQRIINGRDKTPSEDTHLDGGVAAVSNALSVLDTQDMQDTIVETQAFAGAKKARKRLRGDAVSPSPHRPEKKVRKESDFGSPTAPSMRLRNDIDKSEDAEMSFFDESPIKPSVGKNFKSLFDEAEKPLPRLLFPSEPESKQPASVASRGSDSKSQANRLSKFEQKGVQKLQPKLNSFGLSRA